MYLYLNLLRNKRATQTEVNNSLAPWPEIVPKFSEAIPEWRAAWPIHIYLTSIAYIMILLTCLYLLYLKIQDNLQNRGRNSQLSLSLYSNLAICALTRSCALLIDPYASRPSILPIVFHLLWALSLPAFTAAFTMLLLALLDTTKKYKTPPFFHKSRNIAIVIIINFAFVILLELLVQFFTEAKVLLIVCQGTYIVFNLFLSVGYFIAAKRITTNLVTEAQGYDKDFNKSLKRLIYSIYACSILSLLTCISHIYAMVGVYSVLSPVRYAEAWPWWAFQSIQRGLELILCLIMLIIIWGKHSSNRSAPIAPESQHSTFHASDYVQLTSSSKINHNSKE
ncbi:hypothetical protein TrispH2_000569 [Trichoplax sp. H2]|nr:hypothetical protein TrispH2_000569 [Trichoplax sp. H2]|eukprot:RDD47745.1 hypothetical protein TrispH2_000569 [Trichoplax sp. H2]